MSVPAHPETTELGALRPKVFGDRRAERPDCDLSDPDQVFALALAATQANPRQLMRISLAEIRGIANFAVMTGVIASRFAQVLALSDANAPPHELLKALSNAAEIARLHTGKARESAFAEKHGEAREGGFAKT